MLVSARSGVRWGPDPALPGGGRVCTRPAGRMLTRIALRAILVSKLTWLCLPWMTVDAVRRRSSGDHGGARYPGTRADGSQWITHSTNNADGGLGLPAEGGSQVQPESARSSRLLQRALRNFSAR